MRDPNATGAGVALPLDVARHGEGLQGPGRLPFCLLCLLVAAQSYTVPLVAIGPSWAVWPTLPIVTSVGFFGASLLAGGGGLLASKQLLQRYALLFAGSVVSFLVVTVGLHALLLPAMKPDPYFGLYQLYMLVIVGAVFWATSRIRMTPRRRRVLRVVTAVTLSWVCVSVLLTYTEVVPTRAFAPQLPANPLVSGAWAKYVTNWSADGLGTIGYNHAYVAAQVLLLLAFWLHLSPSDTVVPKVFFIILSGVAIFLTGSRAGFAGFVLFLGLILPRRGNALTGLGILAVAPLLLVAVASLEVDFLHMAERQAALLEAPSTETLSERDIIWEERWEFLNADPVRWIIGTGFGSALASGSNAHMLFLQLVLETGILGLVAFLLFAGQVLLLLWRVEQPPRYLFLATVALLFSSLTQETFYPTTSMGFFLAFYFCTVGVALRSHTMRQHPPPPGEWVAQLHASEASNSVVHTTALIPNNHPARHGNAEQS